MMYLVVLQWLVSQRMLLLPQTFVIVLVQVLVLVLVMVAMVIVDTLPVQELDRLPIRMSLQQSYKDQFC